MQPQNDAYAYNIHTLDHTLNWVGAEGGVYFFWTSGGGLRVGTGFDTEGGYRGGTVSKKKISKWP